MHVRNSAVTGIQSLLMSWTSAGESGLQQSGPQPQDVKAAFPAPSKNLNSESRGMVSESDGKRDSSAHARALPSKVSYEPLPEKEEAHALHQSVPFNVHSSNVRPKQSVQSITSRPRSATSRVAHPTDDELLERIKKGEREAYKFLVERYQVGLFSVAFDILKSKEDAEDVVQESLVKAFLSLEQFRGQSSFRTYLYRITVNLAIDYRRRIQRRGGRPQEFEEGKMPDVGGSNDPARTFNSREDLGRLQEALSSLSEEHRIVVMLREIEGMSYSEIAKSVGVSIGTVMSRLHYARKNLHTYLGDDEPSKPHR